MTYNNNKLECIVEALYNKSSPQAIGYMSFDANGNARKITDANTYNNMDPSIQSEYLPYTQDGSVINTSGSVSKLSPRNFTAQISKNLLNQIQQKFPQFLATSNQPSTPTGSNTAMPNQPNTSSQGPKQQSTPMPKTTDIPSWMRGTSRY